MTGLNESGIEIHRDIAAPAQEVFDAFTRAEHFARWFGGETVQVPAEHLRFEAVPGNAWAARMLLPDGNTIDWAGEFLEVDPPQRVVFTITDRPDDPTRAAVTVDLTPFDGGTRVRLAQETPGFPEEAKHALIAGYEGFLDALQRIVAAPGEPRD